MTGDDRVRHCERCDLNVFNLSDMNRADAEELILNSEGRLCVRYHARADGTIITRDCPVGRGLVRRRLRWIAACIVGAFSAIVGTVFAITGGSGFFRVGQMREFKAFAPICDRLSPPPVYIIAGSMSLAPIPNNSVNQKLAESTEHGGSGASSED
ncbi:MAG: hypothetical protein DHS20C16_21730 [Phycisphaerae bacterium]|nr:MAG: hypothetical protein DHS20C16_21730 [Phycisphaerae bacterium]